MSKTNKDSDIHSIDSDSIHSIKSNEAIIKNIQNSQEDIQGTTEVNFSKSIKIDDNFFKYSCNKANRYKYNLTESQSQKLDYINFALRTFCSETIRFIFKEKYFPIGTNLILANLETANYVCLYKIYPFYSLASKFTTNPDKRENNPFNIFAKFDSDTITQFINDDYDNIFTKLNKLNKELGNRFIDNCLKQDTINMDFLENQLKLYNEANSHETSLNNNKNNAGTEVNPDSEEVKSNVSEKDSNDMPELENEDNFPSINKNNNIQATTTPTTEYIKNNLNQSNKFFFPNDTLNNQDTKTYTAKTTDKIKESTSRSKSNDDYFNKSIDINKNISGTLNSNNNNDLIFKKNNSNMNTIISVDNKDINSVYSIEEKENSSIEKMENNDSDIINKNINTQTQYDSYYNNNNNNTGFNNFPFTENNNTISSNDRLYKKDSNNYTTNNQTTTPTKDDIYTFKQQEQPSNTISDSTGNFVFEISRKNINNNNNNNIDIARATKNTDTQSYTKQIMHRDAERVVQDTFYKLTNNIKNEKTINGIPVGNLQISQDDIKVFINVMQVAVKQEIDYEGKEYKGKDAGFNKWATDEHGKYSANSVIGYIFKDTYAYSEDNDYIVSILKKFAVISAQMQKSAATIFDTREGWHYKSQKDGLRSKGVVQLLENFDIDEDYKFNPENKNMHI